MSIRSRGGAHMPGALWIALTASLAGLLLAIAAGCAGRTPDTTEATAVLRASLRVGGQEGKTAIVEASFIPEAPASITFPTTTTLKIVEPDASTGASTTPILTLGGLRTETPLVINSRGTAAIQLTGSTSSTQSGSFILNDGYGHSLRFASLRVTFDHTGLAETNLPREARLVVPLRGAYRSLAEFRVEGATPGQVGNLAIAFDGGATVKLTATADASGVLHYTTVDTGLVENLSSASIEFPSSAESGS
jgi:hypothetical protein